MRVCIIGSNLSALTLAKALVNQNIYVDLISLNKNQKVNKSRTIGITKSNFEFFNKKIINIEKIITKINKIEIYSDNLKNERILNFQNNGEQLFSIIKNFNLHQILNKSLFNSRYYKKKNFGIGSIKFDEYNLIINSDYTSFFTKKYFNKKIVKSYNSQAYSTIINHEKVSNDIAVQIFTKKGPLAFLPISNIQTSVVYSIRDLKNFKKENLSDLIFKYNLKYKIKKIQNIEAFELKSLILRSYYHDNVLAFGDLLHRIHPLAGQGFNMTIRDIETLLNIIKESLSLGLPLDSSINTQFEKKIRHKNYLFSSGVDLIYEFFNFERKINNKFLSKSIQFIGKNSSFNKIITKIADRGIV